MKLFTPSLSLPLPLLISALFLISCNGASDKGEEAREKAQAALESDIKGRAENESAHSTHLASGPLIVIETNLGTIKARLHADRAPLTVTNFLSYVDEGFFDGTIFHRVISNFMIQGGGFEISGGTPKEKKNRSPIQNESQKTHKNTRGTLAMARLNDPHSATSQFFINVQDNPNLDYPSNGGGYAVFGEVIAGMEIVDQIKEVKTDRLPVLNLVGKLYRVGNPSDVPLEPVIITSIRRVASD